MIEGLKGRCKGYDYIYIISMMMLRNVIMEHRVS